MVKSGVLLLACAEAYERAEGRRSRNAIEVESVCKRDWECEFVECDGPHAMIW